MKKQTRSKLKSISTLVFIFIIFIIVKIGEGDPEWAQPMLIGASIGWGIVLLILHLIPIKKK